MLAKLISVIFIMLVGRIIKNTDYFCYHKIMSQS